MYTFWRPSIKARPSGANFERSKRNFAML